MPTTAHVEQEMQLDPEPNTLDIVASTGSKITNVSLYSGRAEITRLFEFSIKAGQNKVTIVGLPRRMEENSLRVEGLGNASIHDVVVAMINCPPQVSSYGNSSNHGVPILITSFSPPPSPQASVTPQIQTGSILGRKRDEIKKGLGSAQQSRETLNAYLKTITATEFDISRLEATLDGFSVLSQKLDKQILDLEREFTEVTKEIEKNERTCNPNVGSKPSWKVSLDVHGQFDEEVKLHVKYFVTGADWTASYDVRVDTEAKEKAITFMYKAVINQWTGESWNNVPLTLETATPSFGVQPPILSPWRVRGPVSVPKITPAAQSPTYMPIGGIPMFGVPMSGIPMSSMPMGMVPASQPVIIQPPVAVSNKGKIAATFRIPGVVNIPSDGQNHNVTVARLGFDSTLMWFSIPSVDTRVHLKANLRNDSEYPLIPGQANIYVDGSFIATTELPLVSAQEVFDCPLGLDASIRITYHPVEKKSSNSGFYSKTSSQSFTQRITIQNTKSTAVQNLKVVDRVPISEDERIEVKVIKPGLTIPTPNTGSTTSISLQTKSAVGRPVSVAQNIYAQWDGTDEIGIDKTGLGKDGKFNWMVAVPPQKSVSLVLQFNVSYPENLNIIGL